MRTGLHQQILANSLGGEKPAPLGKGGVSEGLESGAAFDVSLMIEMVMDGSVGCGEFL